MSFKATKVITDEAMSDIVTTGLEAGSYSSIRLVCYSGPPDAAPAWAEYPDVRYTWAWAVEGGIAVKDNYGDKEFGHVCRETLQKGLEVLAEKYPHLLAQLVSGSYDVIAADALLQAAAFGDVIYG